MTGLGGPDHSYIGSRQVRVDCLWYKTIQIRQLFMSGN